jgi:hypothetical protein
MSDYLHRHHLRHNPGTGPLDVLITLAEHHASSQLSNFFSAHWELTRALLGYGDFSAEVAIVHKNYVYFQQIAREELSKPPRARSKEVDRLGFAWGSFVESVKHLEREAGSLSGRLHVARVHPALIEQLAYDRSYKLPPRRWFTRVGWIASKADPALDLPLFPGAPTRRALLPTPEMTSSTANKWKRLVSDHQKLAEGAQYTGRSGEEAAFNKKLSKLEDRGWNLYLDTEQEQLLQALRRATRAAMKRAREDYSNRLNDEALASNMAARWQSQNPYGTESYSTLFNRALERVRRNRALKEWSEAFWEEVPADRKILLAGDRYLAPTGVDQPIRLDALSQPQRASLTAEFAPHLPVP